MSELTVGKSAAVPVLAAPLHLLPLVAEDGLVERVRAVVHLVRPQHPQLVLPVREVAVVAQLAVLALGELLAQRRLVERVEGDDALLAAGPDLLLGVGEAALVAVAAGAALRPVLAHDSLGVVRREPRPASAPAAQPGPADVPVVLAAAVGVNVSKLAIITKVTFALKLKIKQVD